MSECIPEYIGNAAALGIGSGGGGGGVSEGLPAGYMDGLQANWASNSTIIIETGRCKNDAGDTEDIIVTSQLTADITAGGANGLDTGSEASNTWYSVWAIRKLSDGSVAALLSLSATAPTLPSGYTKKRLVGWVRNDGSSNFLKFKCFGRGKTKRFIYDQAWNVLNFGSSTSWAAVACATYVPPGVFSFWIDTVTDGSFSAYGLWNAFDGDQTNGHFAFADELSSTNMCYATLDSSRQLGYKVDSLGTDFSVDIAGWEGNF